MKRIIALLLVVLMCLSLVACGGRAQKEYERGLKFLEDGNYEEAIIAFTAAIEIDPKFADCYLARAEAYTATGQDLLAAQDIATAQELEEAKGGEAAEGSGASKPSGSASGPKLTDEELAYAVDEFIAGNEAFLSHDWAYLSAKDIDGGAIAGLHPDRVMDIATFEMGYGYEDCGYVPQRYYTSAAEESAVRACAQQYAPLFINFVFGTQELQSAFDRFYGPGRFDVTTWTGDGETEYFLHASPEWDDGGVKAYVDVSVLLTLGLGGGDGGVMTQRGAITREGDKVAVECYSLLWYEMLGEGVVVCGMDAQETQLASGLDWSVLDYTGHVSSINAYEPGSFDRFIGAAGISRDSIKPIRLILFWGDDGALHLWGVER